MPIQVMSEVPAVQQVAPPIAPGVEERPRSWTWLAVGGILLLFANGVNTVWLAAWLAPIFILRFVRTQRKRTGLLVAYLLFVAATAFQLRGMVPIPGIGYYIFLVLFAVPMVLPYVVDRFLAKRLTGLRRTLVFPLVWAISEYLVSRALYGSWGSAAYSQYGNLPLLQLLSVTGLWGITFLIGWTASSANCIWESGWASPIARRDMIIAGGTTVLVFLLGGARLALFPPASATTRVASISRHKMPQDLSPTTWTHMLANTLSPSELQKVRDWAKAIQDDLLTRAEREAQAGAKIVFWGETNSPLLKEDQAAFIERGRELAAKYKVYLGMGIGAWGRGEHKPLENKFVMVGPEGQIAWEYYKSHPVPGGEAAMSVTKDGRLPMVDTPYGRTTAVICFDADFPQLLAQAGKMGADVVLDPSNDWQAIDPWHTQMASFRAVEQGANFVRQTSGGLSAAYDYQGHRLAAMDHYQTSDYAMITQLPTKGVRTIYGKFGDWFAWLCMALFALISVQALRGRKNA